MKKHYGKVKLDRNYTRSLPVDDRLYGAFMEHLGNVIYGGIYNPGHPEADEDGFRKDVIRLLRDLNITAIRYPGGNYICTYNWEDTVGPVSERPRVYSLAWNQEEPNTVGLAEFEKWLDKIGSKLIMAVNLSTRGAVDAANIVEYCNYDGNTKYSALRREHGHEKPYDIRTWCVGNEVDGPWNIGMKDAHTYGVDAREACKAMRRIDENLELVLVGSSGTQVDTYLDWEREVLEQAYEYGDYISLHRYLANMDIEIEGTMDPFDDADYLELATRLERNIKDVVAVCDYVKGHKQTAKTMNISLDEYNVTDTGKRGERGEGLSMRATLLFGLTMLVLMRNSDRVRIACQSILINGGGLVMCNNDDDAWVNGSYYVFRDCSRYGRGRVIEQVSECDSFDTKSFTGADAMDSVCVYHEESGEIDIFAVNKCAEESEFSVDLSNFGALSAIEHITLEAEALDSRNSLRNPNAISPVSYDDITVEGNTISTLLHPYSWNVIRIKEEKK